MFRSTSHLYLALALVACSGSGTNGTISAGTGGATPGTFTSLGGSGQAAIVGGAGTLGGTPASPGSAGNAANTQPFVPGATPAAASFFMKGINLGNRLEAPNEGDWGGKILETDLPFIAKRGFDHVRIPVRFSGHALATSPFTIDATFLSRVDTVLDQAAQAKLGVVLDMHAYDALAADPVGQRERFLAIWAQLASHYQAQPANVAFELLNEPYKQLDTAWNELLSAAIQTIRTTNPTRLLVVDAVSWADPTQLTRLILPDDANIIAAVHLYEPKLFSFQGKSWVGPEFMTTGIVFPGPPSTPVTPVAAATAASWTKNWFDAYNTKPSETNPSGPATIATQIAAVTAYRSSSGRTVYNGEWGPQDGGDLESRARLVTLVQKECEKAGIGWAIWEDTTNMKLFDSAADTWEASIIDALLPP